MPFCKNNSVKRSKCYGLSPKGLGYCAKNEKTGTIKKGKDGEKWIVKVLFENNKVVQKWNKLDIYIIISVNYSIINNFNDIKIKKLPNSWNYIGKDKYNITSKKYVNNEYYKGLKKNLKKAEKIIIDKFNKYKKNKYISKYKITKKETTIDELLKNKKLNKIMINESNHKLKILNNKIKNNNKNEFNFNISKEINESYKYLKKSEDEINSLSKFLKLKLSINLTKKEFNLIIKKLESKDIQNKIIKKLKNIPNKVLNEIYKIYKKKTKDKKIIKEALIIKIKSIYNKKSILDINLQNIIFFNNWDFLIMMVNYNELNNDIKKLIKNI